MKIALFILVISLILFCGFPGAGQQIQENDPISKSTALIKEYIAGDKREIVIVKIVNRHNGTYTITSTLWSGKDSVRVMSHITDMTGGKRDTTLNFPKQVFLFKLDKASFIFNSIVSAGHHQTISIKRGEQETIFSTSYGRALMNLLEDGD